MSKLRCLKCASKIDSKESAFVVEVSKRPDLSISARIAYTAGLQSGSVVLHVNGDRQCKKEVATYRKDLLKALVISGDYDISFLDIY